MFACNLNTWRTEAGGQPVGGASRFTRLEELGEEGEKEVLEGVRGGGRHNYDLVNYIVSEIVHGVVSMSDAIMGCLLFSFGN